ncbi:Laccase-1 [Termitomyces sp. T112]|nr:Laccase-1 [Termitomyces sp. T112]
MCFFLFLVVTAVLTPAALAIIIGPVADLHIVNADIAPDGFTRSGVLAEGTFPGPLITGTKGNTFRLNVINRLTDVTMLKSTSIHWHGLFQKGTPWADGPSFVSQCPIAPGNSFLYTFSSADQAGTFWYHSHLSTQYCDGLRGVFVIYDPNDPHKDLYDVDNEDTVITLADWYHTVAPAAGIVPTSDSTLINGLGRYAGGPTSPLAVINVVRGQRYRFRLVSISCDPNFMFSIDGHKLTIIEVDGVNHVPLVVDSIQIYAGQRYSFVLNANQVVANYWIRANPNVGTIGFLGGLNSAILRYNGAPIADPFTLGPIYLKPLFICLNSPLRTPAQYVDHFLTDISVPILIPVTIKPGAPDINGADINLNLALGITTSPPIQFTINNATFVPPTVPVLLQILSGATTASSLLPAGSVYTLPLNRVIQITISSGLAPGAPHPFHLHGHTFDVIRSAGSLVYNYANPVRRDVVSAGGPLDSVTIRFETDNSGPWFLHCHIDWHLELGLAIVLAEDAPGTSALVAPPGKC